MKTVKLQTSVTVRTAERIKQLAEREDRSVAWVQRSLMEAELRRREADADVDRARKDEAERRQIYDRHMQVAKEGK